MSTVFYLLDHRAGFTLQIKSANKGHAGVSKACKAQMVCQSGSPPVRCSRDARPTICCRWIRELGEKIKGSKDQRIKRCNLR